jgi:hypothetical protein
MKISLVAIAILMMVKVSAGAWTIETVATLSDACKGVGLALDGNNKPHIVYAETNTDSAYVQEIYKDAGGTWLGPFNTNCPHSENMEAYGPWSCVALDAQNDTFWVITLFGYEGYSYIYAAHKDGISGAWSSKTAVRSHYGTWPARFTACDVVAESGEVVHLLYSDYNDISICYTKRTAGGWGGDETIGTGGMDYGFWYYYKPSIELEDSTPHCAGWFYNDDLTYYDILPSYRDKAGGTWGTRIRMSNWGWWPNSGGGYVSLTLNPLGNNYDWACWGDPEDTGIVRYGQRSETGWTSSPAVTPSDMGIGVFCADIVGYANLVFLAYRNSSGELKLARYEILGSPTTTEEVDTLPSNVSHVCLKMASDGSAHIAYAAVESDSIKIKYAYAEDVGIEETHNLKPQVQNPQLIISPNPFSKLTNISFGNVQGAKGIELKIHDATGRLVKSFSLPHVYSLLPTVLWDGTDDAHQKVPAGVYFVQFKVGDHIQVEKAILVK